MQKLKLLIKLFNSEYMNDFDSNAISQNTQVIL